MKVIEILDHVAPAQKKALATYANKFGAVALVRHAITWGGKGLLEFADTVVPRQFGSRCRFKTLSPQQRRLNVAERLVVAFRIAGKFGGEESQASAPSVVAKEILHRTTGGPNAKRRPAVMPRQSLPGVMIPSEDVRSRIVGKLRALPDFKWRKKWQNFGDVDGLRALICQIPRPALARAPFVFDSTQQRRSDHRKAAASWRGHRHARGV